MRIVSRLNEDEAQLARLKDILEAASHGVISENGDTKPGQTLSDLVTQIDELAADYMETVDVLEENYEALQHEVLSLNAQCLHQEKMITKLIEGVRYDDALEYATIDLIDSLLGSGAASTTFSGNLSFDPRVVLVKDDFKPILRQAIETWVNMKVR
ncbi:hypothetical protein [Acinetobacter sp.]|uniref:hypothetical protein n=1 Tax=Acinetobacter sp. TaxID=472 RepID=UPI00388F5AF6